MEDLSIHSLFNVKGKIAVVTGGGSGLGTMIASTLVQNGAKVYIASRKEKQLKEVSDALNKQGPGSCHYIVADIGSKAGCDALSSAIKEKESKIHILVNNSGATWGAKFESVPEKEGWDRVMAVNVKSVFYLTQGLTELLAKGATGEDPGRVINISSIAGISPIAEGSNVSAKGTGIWSYHTSKAAVIHLTTQLAVSLGPRFITVNAICPGVFPSKMTAYGFRTNGDDQMAYGVPMGRVGFPRDIGGLVLFLVSAAGAYVTGDHILLDGGKMISGARL